MRRRGKKNKHETGRRESKEAGSPGENSRGKATLRRPGRHPQAQPQAGWGRRGGRGARIGPPSQWPNRAHDVVDSDRFGNDILPS